MKRLQKKLRSLPLPAQMLATGALLFLWLLVAFELASPEFLSGSGIIFELDDLYVPGGAALIVMLFPLYRERQSLRRPFLIAAMVGCVLMLMGYSFVTGYVASHAGEMPQGGVWQWFTVFFVFLVPVVGFVQAFRAYTREQPENGDS